MLQYVYKALKQRILEKVEEVKQVDWYFKQYEEGEDGNLVWITPSVYVEFELPIVFEQRGLQMQRSTLNVVLHVVSASGYGAEDMRQTEHTDNLTMTHLDLCQKIYKAFQGVSFAYKYLQQFPLVDDLLISGMIRTGMEVSHELSVFNVSKLFFTLNAQDSDALPQENIIEQTLDLSIEGDLVSSIGI
ncbi:MAG: hypothetical protein U5L45_05335 [Saprospiraceae bacterium]|nr:hypothetical protein [Saprospiraceae bacterium]